MLLVGDDRCTAAQIVQTLAGRKDADAPGDGHCDAVLAVDAHPKVSAIASGALERDATIKVWADPTDPSIHASMFDEARRHAAETAAAAPAAAGEPAHNDGCPAPAAAHELLEDRGTAAEGGDHGAEGEDAAERAAQRMDVDGREGGAAEAEAAPPEQ